MVFTSRDVRASPKVAWDIALALIVVSPRAHEPTGSHLRTGKTGCAQRKRKGNKAPSAVQVQRTPRGARNDERREIFHERGVSKVRTVRAKRAKKHNDSYTTACRGNPRGTHRTIHAQSMSRTSDFAMKNEFIYRFSIPLIGIRFSSVAGGGARQILCEAAVRRASWISATEIALAPRPRPAQC